MTDLKSEGIDTSDMRAPHGALRDALRQAPVLVGSVPDGDRERAALVATFYRNVLLFLKAHHEGEDELVWPRLRERAVGSADLCVRMADQHDALVGLKDSALDALPAWELSGSAADGAVLAFALTNLSSELENHLAEEEREVLPLASRHMTEEEWGALPGHALRGFEGDKVWLILGLVREHMTDDQREIMLAAMPPPVSAMWWETGADTFAGFVAALRG